MTSGESGQGLIPTVSGFTVLLGLLLFATQALFDLYARSAVTSAAVTAARAVAGYADSSAYLGGPSTPAERTAIEAAQARALSSLGAYARVTTFDWAGTTGGEVVLRVRFDTSGTSLTHLVRIPSLDHFARTVKVRVEHVVCPPRTSCSVLTAGGT